MVYLFDEIKARKGKIEPSEIGIHARREYQWLRTLHPNGEVRDSWAWYFKMLSEDYLNKGNPQTVEYMKKYLTTEAVTYCPFDLIYSEVQSGKMNERRGFKVLRTLIRSRYKYLQLSKDEWRSVIQTKQLTPEGLLYAVQFFGTAGQYPKIPEKVAHICTTEFLRRKFNLREVSHLARDTNADVHSIVSMNHLQQLHDDQAAVARKKVADSKKTVYEYNDTFVHTCAAYGWRQPKGSADMFMRGEQHHNCVASYTAKQVSEVPDQGTISRLVFSDMATAEIRISIKGGKVTQVTLQQCKGMRNKDVPFGLWGEFSDAIKALSPSAFEVTCSGEDYVPAK